eukprot:351369-Chlamydomonas_euryale.AAC.4
MKESMKGAVENVQPQTPKDKPPSLPLSLSHSFSPGLLERGPGFVEVGSTMLAGIAVKAGNPAV